MTFTHLKGRPLRVLNAWLYVFFRRTVGVPGYFQGQRERTQYQCLLCNYNTSGKRRLIRQHVSNVHKTSERVSCDLCGNSFKNINSLKSHLTKCRKKHGIILSQNNPHSLLRPVREEKETVDCDGDVSEQRNSIISEISPLSILKTIKKEKVSEDDIDDGEQAKTQYTWVIEKFKWRPEKVGDVISSGNFSVNGPGSQVTEWCLEMYPMGRRDEKKGFVSVYHKSQNIIPVRASFTLYVVTGHNRKECIFRECEEVCDFQPLDCDNGNRWGNTEFIHEEMFKEPDFLNGDGDLKVVVDLTVYGPEKTDGEQRGSDSDPLSLLKPTKKQTVSVDEDDNRAPVDGEYDVSGENQGASLNGRLDRNDEDMFGLD